MVQNKKIFEELFKGNRSFSVVSAVLNYFNQSKTEADVENTQRNEWKKTLSDNDTPKAELSHVLYRIKYQILLEKTQRQKQLRIRISQIAAILILPLLLLFVFKYNQLPNQGRQSQVDLHCPEGARTKFNLPDGSTGWLAGGSTLSYDLNFQTKRNVSVEGEAFFSVVHDKKRPFVVELGDLNVKVLGTKFNVLNYAAEPISEVVVLSGLVEVKEKDNRFSEQLSPNKKLQVHKLQNSVVLSEVNAKSYTSWTKGILEFNDEHLESVCRKIERFYDVDVELNNEGLQNNTFRANIKIGSLEELLKFMSLALPIKYELTEAKQSANETVEQRKLIISKK